MEKVLTKNGVRFVAIVGARKLNYYHALEEEHGWGIHPILNPGLRQPRGL